uniref:Transmembrane protein n=1 Tax=Trypanosoma congolense (strain IL3000) TaxID=1068625 RepID=G0UZD9_TRYCI|nr:conserved hypothetical protein [Trypanosoma congolense IL3000]
MDDPVTFVHDSAPEFGNRRSCGEESVDNNPGDHKVVYVKAPLVLTEYNSSVAPRSPHTVGCYSTSRHARRKRFAGTRTLYVRSDETESEPKESPEPTSDVRELVSVNQATQSAVISASGWSLSIMDAVAMGGGVMMRATNLLPSAVRDMRRIPYMTAMLVFVFFLLSFMFLLLVSEKQAQVAAKLIEHDNRQKLFFAASLVEQYLAEVNVAKRLMDPRARKPPDAIKRAKLVVEELGALCNDSIKQLHQRLIHIGPAEDIKFLLEEHVAYEANVARLIKEEMKWLEQRKLHYNHMLKYRGKTRGAGETSRAKENDQPRGPQGGRKPAVFPRTGPHLDREEKRHVKPEAPVTFLRAFIDLCLSSRIVVLIVVVLLFVFYCRLS